MAFSTIQEQGEMTAEKVRENRLRRVAERQGFVLRKSRRRDRRALDYGELWLTRFLVETPSGRFEALASPDDRDDAWLGPFLGLDDLESWLDADPDTRPDLEDRRNAGDGWLNEFRRKSSRAPGDDA